MSLLLQRREILSRRQSVQKKFSDKLTLTLPRSITDHNQSSLLQKLELLSRQSLGNHFQHKPTITELRKITESTITVKTFFRRTNHCRTKTDYRVHNHCRKIFSDELTNAALRHYTEQTITVQNYFLTIFRSQPLENLRRSLSQLSLGEKFQ